MTTLFFFGTLCHLPLLQAVLGRNAEVAQATYADHKVSWVAGQTFPMIENIAGETATGVVVRGLESPDLARLDFYTAGFIATPREIVVDAGRGSEMALAYFPDTTAWAAGKPWHLADWAEVWAETVVATANDVMALFGKSAGVDVGKRRPAMMVRGAARVRAAQTTPADLRRATLPGDVAVDKRHYPYANFFSVEEFDLSYRRFDGTMSRVVNRATFISGDAVTVLPYDPVRDRVLVIEQFRAGPYARGDANPWQLEAIAGRIDPGEDAQMAARREAVEEAGLHLGDLIPVANYYPTPGAKTEFLYSFIGLCDLPDGCAGVFGMDSEAEDIRGHLIAFDRLMDLVATGEASNAPLILTALWLQRERARLRRL